MFPELASYELEPFFLLFILAFPRHHQNYTSS